MPAALLACAIPTGYGSAVHRANVRGGDTVVVIGAGGIGTAAIQGARINGAARIVAVDPVEFKRDSALGFGATHTAATAFEAIDLVRELTRGVMADAVVVASRYGCRATTSATRWRSPARAEPACSPVWRRRRRTRSRSTCRTSS